MIVHFCQRLEIVSLKINEALVFVPFKYTDFADIFSKNLDVELSKYNRINDYAIKLIKGYQPPYGPIYSIELVALETLKTYIKTSLVNNFIRPFKSLGDALIFFFKKPNRSY